MRIAIDAMGGDNAPGAEVQGAIEAVREWNVEVTLVGDEKQILAAAAEHGGLPPGATVHHTTEVITTHDEPTRAFRTKKDASMVVAARLVKEGQADALVTAGSTGALVVIGTLGIGRMKGIDRPALGTIFPTAEEPVFVLDVGATVDAKPDWLVQFALMGDVYCREVLRRTNPRVSLLNNGAEAEKGNALTKAAYPLLAAAPGINFAGNIEARDVPFGKTDVVVADGFAGNVLLKTYEGVGLALMKLLKQAMTATPVSTLGALLVKPSLKGFAKKFDYTEYGGALLLGLKAPVVKCHGASDAKAIKSGIRVMRAALEGRVIEKLGAALEAYQTSHAKL